MLLFCRRRPRLFCLSSLLRSKKPTQRKPVPVPTHNLYLISIFSAGCQAKILVSLYLSGSHLQSQVKSRRQMMYVCMMYLCRAAVTNIHLFIGEHQLGAIFKKRVTRFEDEC